MAYDIATELQVSPWESLLIGVRKAAGRAAWVDAQLDNAVRRNDGRPDSPEVMRWLAESRKERALQARVAKAAIDAGVAERVVRQLELEGKVLLAAMLAGLDAIPGLSEDSRLAALAAAQQHLYAIESGEPMTT